MSLQFPSSPVIGQVFPSPLVPGAPSWTFDGSKWVSGGFSGAVVSTSPLPPLNPRVGDLWFDPTQGQTYVYFDDGVSKQWVIAVNLSALSMPTVFDQPQLNQPRIMGVTDGSDAAPGEVGEYLSVLGAVQAISGTATNLTNSTIVLSAGDWQVQGYVNFSATTVGYAWIQNLTAAGTLQGPFTVIGGLASTGLTIVCGPSRLNITAQASLCMRAQAGGAANVLGFISARRMR